MKLIGACLCAMALLLTGCTLFSGGSKSDSPEANGPIVSPDNSLTGKVVRVNEQGHFVVLQFPITRMAPVEKRLFVYHKGLKSAEVRVTGPQQDDHIVADVVSGVAYVGDEVREN